MIVCTRLRPTTVTIATPAHTLDDALTLVTHGSTLNQQLTFSSLAPNSPAGSPGGRRA